MINGKMSMIVDVDEDEWDEDEWDEDEAKDVVDKVKEADSDKVDGDSGSGSEIKIGFRVVFWSFDCVELNI